MVERIEVFIGGVVEELLLRSSHRIVSLCRVCALFRTSAPRFAFLGRDLTITTKDSASQVTNFLHLRFISVIFTISFLPFGFL